MSPARDARRYRELREAVAVIAARIEGAPDPITAIAADLRAALRAADANCSPEPSPAHRGVVMRNKTRQFAEHLLNLADDLSEEARVERLHAKDDGGTAHYAAGLEDAAERIRGVIEELQRAQGAR